MNSGSRPKGAITNAAWNTFGTICAIVTSFLTAPILIRYLGTSQYGIFLLIGSILGLLGIMNFGMGEATLRYVARYYGEGDSAGVNRVFGSTLSFYVVIASIATLILLIGAPTVVTWLNIPPSQYELVGRLVRIAALVFSLGIITSAFAVIPSALQRYDISTRVGIGITTVRSVGYIGLPILGFGLIELLQWELMLGFTSLFVRVLVAWRLLPDLRLLPSFSFHGLREIVGYSIFSFLTWTFHTMHRESGKLMLGRAMGMAPVAFLGTPDSIAQRIHMVVSSGSEALIPRFSANRDLKADEKLFWSATWSALALSLILLIPFCVLVPDFLKLWINVDFARESGIAGRVLGVYLVWQGAFAPVAAYFRGTDRPWFVTVVILLSLIITVLMSLYLIPRYGVEGAAYAYLAGSAAPFLGVVVGGIYAFGRSSLPVLLQTVGIPATAGSVAFMAGLLIRSSVGDLTWFGLLAQAVLLSSVCAILIIGADWLLGGQRSPSRQLLERMAANRSVRALVRLIPVKPAC